MPGDVNRHPSMDVPCSARVVKDTEKGGAASRACGLRIRGQRGPVELMAGRHIKAEGRTACPLPPITKSIKRPRRGG